MRDPWLQSAGTVGDLHVERLLSRIPNGGNGHKAALKIFDVTSLEWVDLVPPDSAFCLS